VPPEPLGFLPRVGMFFTLPWRVLTDGSLAGRIVALQAGAPLLEEREEPEAVPADPTTALQLLGILQREGRLIDFLQEDVTDVPDADIGAAARVVHEGCRRGLREVLELRPVRAESDGDAIVLESGFDATRHRLTGNVSGEPPYRGHLAHHGWEVARIDLPTLTDGHDPSVIAAAEVEL
jgi:hypothetical protein